MHKDVKLEDIVRAAAPFDDPQKIHQIAYILRAKGAQFRAHFTLTPVGLYSAEVDYAVEAVRRKVPPASGGAGQGDVQ